MINKNFKRIFNKYSNIFKFIFYLKYLFLIFFISLLTYLVVPKFFNFSEKQFYLKKHLEQNYDLKIKNIEKIQYNIFPVPNLEIKNASLNFLNDDLEIEAKKVYIFPNILKIYNFENFKSNKINFINCDIKIKTKYISSFYKKIVSQKNKINFHKTTIQLLDDTKPVLSLTNLNYSNYGHKKNLVHGKVFNKNFRIKVSEKLDNINFKLINTGIFGEIVYLGNTVNKVKLGKFKGKILNSNIKFNFSIDEKELIIQDYIFRNKDLSYDSNGKIIFSPFFSIDLKSKIKDINKDLFYKINFKKLFKNKDFLKRLNINQEVVYSSKRFSRNFVRNLNAKIDLAYGRIVINKTILLDKGEINCNSEMNLIDEDSILILKCQITSEDEKNFLRSFLKNYNGKNEALNLEIKANLNLIQKKINFLIVTNNTYQASEEDLKFFKEIFEITFLEDNLLDIFNTKKINNFLENIL